MSTVRPTAGFELCCFNSTCLLHSTRSTRVHCFAVYATRLVYQALALNWIASYLVGRKQSVRVGQQQSVNIDCEHGDPQGSALLGALLFALYMSPVARVIASFGIDHTQYADDTELYVALNDAKTVPNLTDCFHAIHIAGSTSIYCP